MLNKREVEQLYCFLSSLQELARSILDEVAEFECIVDENKEKRKSETLDRYQRKKKLLNKRKSQSR